VPGEAVAADAATTAPVTPNLTRQTAQSGGEARPPEEPPLDEFWEDMPDIFGLIGSPLGGIHRRLLLRALCPGLRIEPTTPDANRNGKSDAPEPLPPGEEMGPLQPEE